MDHWRKYISILFLFVGSLIAPISDDKINAQGLCPKGMVCLFKDGTTDIFVKVPDIGPLDIVPVPFDKKAELGKQLFCDHRFSADNKYACAQCHQPHQGFTVNLQLPLGVGGLAAGHRNSPTLYNLDYMDNVGARHRQPVLWDGRAESLEQHLAAIDMSPLKALREQGMEDADHIMEKLARLPFGHPDSDEYRRKFSEAFPSVNDITSLNPQDRAWNFTFFVKAIVAYERTLVSVDSPFDQYMHEYVKHHPDGLPSTGSFEDFGIEKFKEKQWKGMLLFRGKGRCILCHSGPNFTDNQFHNVGWPAERRNDETWNYKLKNGDVLDPGRYCKKYKSEERPNLSPEHRPVDTAVFSHRSFSPDCKDHRSDKVRENGAFKTPTLRNIEETWPYMHDGGMPEFEGLRVELDKDQRIKNALRAVVEFFNKGGAEGNPFADPLMSLPLNLTEEEISNLVAFLRSLTGKPLDDKITNECPFPDINSNISSNNVSTPTP